MAPSLISFTGLIRYKIVIHCFVDGKSRLVTGILASNNNRAGTVLDLFVNAIGQWGRPRRVRGDHGTENVLVALMMEKLTGEVDSYIWGKYVFQCWFSEVISNQI